MLSTIIQNQCFVESFGGTRKDRKQGRVAINAYSASGKTCAFVVMVY